MIKSLIKSRITPIDFDGMDWAPAEVKAKLAACGRCSLPFKLLHANSGQVLRAATATEILLSEQAIENDEEEEWFDRHFGCEVVVSQPVFYQIR